MKSRLQSLTNNVVLVNCGRTMKVIHKHVECIARLNALDVLPDFQVVTGGRPLGMAWAKLRGILVRLRLPNHVSLAMMLVFSAASGWTWPRVLCDSVSSFLHV